MDSADRIAVIVNPRSAHGRTGKRWPVILENLHRHLPDFEVFFTERSGHGTELTRNALKNGFTRIVSVGGDGTHFEVSGGFFEGTRPVNPEAVLAILPHGTGSDLARSLRLPRRLEDALPHVTRGRVIRMDVARITCRSMEGGEVMCHFLNTSRIGMGGEVVYQVNRNTKAWGGFISYCWAMLRTLFVYRDRKMRIEIDGRVTEQVVKEIIIANGQYDGGGMHVAPDALLNDGLFDIYIIGPIALWDALRSVPLIYRGGLMKRPDVISYHRGWVIRVDSAEEVKINTDGEVPGVLPATIELLPAAIRVVAGTDAPLG